MDYKITKNGRLAQINCVGSFTFNDHETFRDLLTTLSSVTDVDGIQFDLKQLTFIDSAAIGMLLIANDEATSRKQHLIVCGAQDQARMAIEIADLKSLLTIKE